MCEREGVCFKKLNAGGGNPEIDEGAAIHRHGVTSGHDCYMYPSFQLRQVAVSLWLLLIFILTIIKHIIMMIHYNGLLNSGVETNCTHEVNSELTSNYTTN